MVRPPLSPQEVARLVLDAAAVRAGPDASPDAAVRLALRTLRDTLGRWVGADAFDSLVERACLLANLRNPNLPVLSWRPDVERGARDLVAPSGADWDAVEGGQMIVEALAELLARFVGDALARQLLLEGWDTNGTPAADVKKEPK